MESRPLAHCFNDACKFELLDGYGTVPGSSVEQCGDGGPYAFSELVRWKRIKFYAVTAIPQNKIWGSGVGIFHSQGRKIKPLDVLLMDCKASQLYVVGLETPGDFLLVHQNAR
jgi:hypothetical protein